MRIRRARLPHETPDSCSCSRDAHLLHGSGWANSFCEPKFWRLRVLLWRARWQIRRFHGAKQTGESPVTRMSKGRQTSSPPRDSIASWGSCALMRDGRQPLTDSRHLNVAWWKFTKNLFNGGGCVTHSCSKLGLAKQLFSCSNFFEKFNQNDL